MFQFEKYSLNEHVVNLCFVSALFCTSFAIVVWFSQQIEQYFNINALYASLLFLPHGVRVLTAIIFKPVLAFTYLFIASVIASYTVWPNTFDHTYLRLLQFSVGAACAPLSLAILSSAIGFDKAHIRKVDRRSWRVLGLAILFSAFLNSLGQSVIVAISGRAMAEIGLVLTFLAGDILGAVICIGVAHIFMKRIL